MDTRKWGCGELADKPLVRKQSTLEQYFTLDLDESSEDEEDERNQRKWLAIEQRNKVRRLLDAGFTRENCPDDSLCSTEES